MTRSPLPALLALAAVAALWALPPAAQPAQEAPAITRDEPRVRPESRLVPQRQWEYTQLPCIPIADPNGSRREVEDRLNEQGKRGWELVTLAEVEHPPTRGCLLATFKRQVLN